MGTSSVREFNIFEACMGMGAVFLVVRWHLAELNLKKILIKIYIVRVSLYEPNCNLHSGFLVFSSKLFCLASL